MRLALVMTCKAVSGELFVSAAVLAMTSMTSSVNISTNVHISAESEAPVTTSSVMTEQQNITISLGTVGSVLKDHETETAGAVLESWPQDNPRGDTRSWRSWFKSAGCGTEALAQL